MHAIQFNFVNAVAEVELQMGERRVLAVVPGVRVNVEYKQNK